MKSAVDCTNILFSRYFEYKYTTLFIYRQKIVNYEL